MHVIVAELPARAHDWRPFPVKHKACNEVLLPSGIITGSQIKRKSVKAFCAFNDLSYRRSHIRLSRVSGLSIRFSLGGRLSNLVDEKKRSYSLNRGNVYALKENRAAARPLKAGDSRAEIRDFTRCARTLAVGQEEADRMQWLNDRIETLALCRDEYIHSLFTKYNLDEDEWEYMASDGRFVRRRSCCPRSP